MSCFVVSSTHIAAMLGTVRSFNPTWSRSSDLTMAKTLVAENVRSVNERYSARHPKVDGPTVTAEQIETYRAYPLTPVAMLKALRCYAYQTCEVTNYDTTLRPLIEALEAETVHKLPGFEEAGWAL